MATPKVNISPIIFLSLKESEFVFDIERIVRLKHERNSRLIFITFNDQETEVITYLPEETAKADGFIKDTIVKMKNWNEELAIIRKTMVNDEI